MRKKQKIKNKTYQRAFVFGKNPKIIPQQIAWAISFGCELLFNALKILVKNFIIVKTSFLNKSIKMEQSGIFYRIKNSTNIPLNVKNS